MTHFASTRLRSLLGGLLALAAFASGCITADGTLRPDGSVSLTLNFQTTATPEDDQAARALVSATDVTIDSIAIADAAPSERGPRRATAKLTAKTAAALNTLPLLRVVGATITQETSDAGGTLRIALLNPTPNKNNDDLITRMNAHQASVRVHVPGPVVETSGTTRDDGAEWTFPAGDWTAGKSLAFTVRYGTASEGTTPAKGDAAS